MYYDVKLLERARESIMQNFLKGNNCGLVVARQCVGDWQYVFCTKFINEFNLTGTAGRFGAGNTFPLYTYTKAIQSTIFNVNEDAEFYGDKQISYDS